MTILGFRQTEELIKDANVNEWEKEITGEEEGNELIHAKYFLSVLIMHLFGLLNIPKTIIANDSFTNLTLTLTIYPYLIQKIIIGKYVKELFMISLFFVSKPKIPHILTVLTISANTGWVIAQLIFIYSFVTNLFNRSTESRVVVLLIYALSICFQLDNESENLMIDKFFNLIFKIPSTIGYFASRLNSILGVFIKILLLIGIIPGVYYSIISFFKQIT